MLPSPNPDQTYITVSPILGGQITLPEKLFIDPADPLAKHTVPSLSFLITHPQHKLLFDLALRSELAGYSQSQQQHLQNRKPYLLGPGVAAVLRSGGHEPEGIDTVVLSHVHYDHHGDPEHLPHARFVVGPGTTRLLEHGLESGGASHQHFSPGLLPADRTVELPAVTQGTGASAADADFKWTPLDPFASIDLFGDGSVYVLDSPGHLPGHVNLLCRLGPGKWACLCGDAYHDRQLLTRERDIAFWDGGGGALCCIHNGPDAARRALVQLRELMDTRDVEMIGAHDKGWFEGNGGACFLLLSRILRWEYEQIHEETLLRLNSLSSLVFLRSNAHPPLSLIKLL